MTHSGKVRAGIGGWTYEPWRGTFYPPGLPHARELEHAASRVSAIEINGTYYRLQKPESFARWAEAVPPGFVFTIKATRFCTNRSEEHTSELQSLMRISYALFCLKINKNIS